MANGDGFWSGMPWYVKAIAVVGVPSLISIGVVWSDRVQLVDRIDAQTRLLATIQLEAKEHAQTDGSLNGAILEAQKETNRILLAGCVNDATTKPNPIEARERCIGRR